jgi:hypothetical protein
MGQRGGAKSALFSALYQYKSLNQLNMKELIKYTMSRVLSEFMKNTFQE